MSKTDEQLQAGMPSAAPPALRRAHPLRWLLAVALMSALALLIWVWWPATTPPADEAAAADAPLTATGLRRAYTDTVPAGERLRFFGEFISYASVDEVERGLLAAGYSPQIRSFHREVADGVPPSHLDTLRVGDYRHLDVDGTLELQFFNDRLYQLEFEPVDAARYRRAFRARWPQLRREASGRAESTAGALRIASSLDLSVSDVGQALQTRPFALWQDLRLLRQRDAWDSQFARQALE